MKNPPQREPGHGRRILHIDMDAFYASVEQQDNPALKGRPVIVGGSPEARGVVSAASYEARVFGIHSAQPAARARKLCPQGVFLPVRMERYREVSRHIFEIFREYTPRIEPLSLDESFLDVTGCETLFGPARQIAAELKKKIRNRTGLTASAGIAPNKFLAKIASDWEKPDGLVEIKPEEVGAFLENLPVAKLWGVGKATEEILMEMGIARAGQLARHPPETLVKKLGKFGLELLALARGEDDRPVAAGEEAKSVSQEKTFTPDLADRRQMFRIILEQAEEVGWELRRQRVKGQTVQLKVRYPDFTLITRSQTLPIPTDAGMEIYRTALGLLEKTEAFARKVRLLGVGVSNLRPRDDPSPRGLFDSYREKEEKSLEAVDRIWDKFGRQALKRASLLENERDGEKGPGPARRKGS